MEASVDQVVGWLQRAALWLAGVFMLLQTRTIRNKFTEMKQLLLICVATAQHTALAADAAVWRGPSMIVVLHSNKSYQSDEDYQFEQLIALIYDSPRRVVFHLPIPRLSLSLSLSQPQPQPQPQPKETPCP